MNIIISNSGNLPIYEQITNQIKDMIMRGELQGGEALPSMRALAKDLHISVITTKRAYEELERSGFPYGCRQRKFCIGCEYGSHEGRTVSKDRRNFDGRCSSCKAEWNQL